MEPIYRWLKAESLIHPAEGNSSILELEVPEKNQCQVQPTQYA